MARIVSACAILLLAGPGLAAGDVLQSLIDAEHEFGELVAKEGVATRSSPC